MTISAVIFDWAGTTIDYGCFSPLSPFISAFAKRGITVTPAEARGPMGKLKIDHVRDLIELPSVRKQFVQLYQREATQDDVAAIYADFEREVFAGLAEFVIPIPHVIDCIAQLRQMGLKIGSTTGYTREMMEIVRPLAREQGYSPDFCVTASEVKRGRPYPYMIYQNLQKLDIPYVREVIKVGDTVSDIQEGINAGCISVGVIEGSSELGLSLAEFNELDHPTRAQKMQQVRFRMYAAGADYVIDNIAELPELIEAINNLTKKQG